MNGIDRGAGGANAFRFAPKKSCRTDLVFQRGRVRFGKGCRGRVLFEEPRRDHVHALVGALSTQNRRDQKLEWIFEVQLAMRIRINLPEALHQSEHAFASRHTVLIAINDSFATNDDDGRVSQTGFLAEECAVPRRIRSPESQVQSEL